MCDKCDSRVSFDQVISTRKVQTEDGTLFLDMKCGNLMQQRITRIQTEQANEIARLIRQYITIDQRIRGTQPPTHANAGGEVGYLVKLICSGCCVIPTSSLLLVSNGKDLTLSRIVGKYLFSFRPGRTKRGTRPRRAESDQKRDGKMEVLKFFSI